MERAPRQKLPITQKATHYRVHYLALERHLALVYRLRGFSVLRATGAGPGLYPEYLVREAVPVDSQQEAAQIRRGCHSHDLGLILTMLCADGYIPAGACVIDTERPRSPLDAYKLLLQHTLDPLHPDCVALKERHRKNQFFNKQARIVDRSLMEWLKKQNEEPHRGL